MLYLFQSSKNTFRSAVNVIRIEFMVCKLFVKLFLYWVFPPFKSILNIV